jgi:site-specific recombinase XerD
MGARGGKRGVSNGSKNGWKLRPQKGNRIITVRLWIDGSEAERSTGTRDREEALKAGERIYAEEVIKASLTPKSERRKKSREQGAALPTLFADWLACLATTHAPKTLEIWELYTKNRWIPWFGGPTATVAELTRERFQEYMRTRLGQVRATSVKKELAALRSFCSWLEAEGHAIELPAAELVPRLPKRAAGVAYGKRRRVAAPQLAPDQIRALLRALPAWSSGERGREPFMVRARFFLQYETSLRPSTWDRIRTPEHARLGSGRLRISPEIDKAKYGRDVPLSRRARLMLYWVLRTLDRLRGHKYEGPVFDAHDYRNHIARAAKLTLPPEVAEIFCAAHLRSARITHLLEDGANIMGTQQLAGHKQLSTTSRYAKPSFRAAEAALATSKKPTR